MELISDENIKQIVTRLTKVGLNPRQKSIVKKFRKNLKSRDFLPLFYLLVELGYDSVATNFLYTKLEEHPSFSAARLALAENLINAGNLNLAAEVIDASPVDERNNRNMQKLRLFLGFLAGDQEVVRRILTELAIRKLLDPEINKLQDAFTLYGLEPAQEEVKKFLCLRFPELKIWEMGNIGNSAKGDKEFSISDAKKTDSHAFAIGAADDFRVVAIDEVLPLKGMGGHAEAGNNKDVFSLNIDSVTLAEIYEKQGLFSKALKIYQRILLTHPRNQTLRKKVEELAGLEKQQSLSGPQITSEVAQKVESIHNIERNISFFEDLLIRLKSR